MKPKLTGGFDSGYKAKLPKKGKPKKPAGIRLPADPTAPLRGKDLKRYINAADRIQNRPLARQLAAEHKASRFRETQEIPAFFQQYQNDLARLRGETEAKYGAAQGAIQNAATLAGQQDASNRAAMEQRAMADAQMRGVAYDPSTLASVANAEAARQHVAASTLGTVAGQGANAFARNTTAQGIAGLQAIEQRGTEAARRRKIEADRRELARSRGDYKYQTLRDIIESERKYDTELKAVRSDKAIAKMEERGRNSRAALSAATSRANARLSQKGQNRRQEDDQRFDAKQKRKDRKADKAGKKKGKKL